MDGAFADGADRTPIGSEKLAMSLAQRIVRDIARAKLVPGDRLPSEQEMLADYGSGRGTLREAMRFLELQGVLEIKPGRGGGPVVAMPNSRHLAMTMALLLQFNEATFSSVMVARKQIEPVTARLSAQTPVAGLADQLKRSIEVMRESIGDAEAFLRENRRFHDLVAWGSGNPILGYVINSLHWITDGTVLGAQYPTKFQTGICSAHERIVEAIVNGDADAASYQMEKHIEEAIAYFKNKYPELLDARLTWHSIT